MFVCATDEWRDHKRQNCRQVNLQEREQHQREHNRSAAPAVPRLISEALSSLPQISPGAPRRGERRQQNACRCCCHGEKLLDLLMKYEIGVKKESLPIYSLGA